MIGLFKWFSYGTESALDSLEFSNFLAYWRYI